SFVQLGRLGGPLEQAGVLALPDLLGPCLQTLHVHSISPPGSSSLPTAGAGGQSDEVADRGAPDVTEWAWPGPAGSGPEVHELQGDAEVVLLDGPDDGLEVVLLLAGDPNLVALDLALHLQPGRLHELDDLLGLLLGDADRHVDALLDGAPGRRLDRPLGQRLQGDLP